MKKLIILLLIFVGCASTPSDFKTDTNDQTINRIVYHEDFTEFKTKKVISIVATTFSSFTITFEDGSSLAFTSRDRIHVTKRK